jgi:hypothetical protein
MPSLRSSTPMATPCSRLPPSLSSRQQLDDRDIAAFFRQKDAELRADEASAQDDDFLPAFSG